MAKPASVLSSDTFATWRTNYNTLLGQVPEVVESASAPTVNDDITNYQNGTLWIQSNGDAFILVDNTDGAADWLQLGATPGALLNDGTVPLTADWDVGGFDLQNVAMLTVNDGIVSDNNADQMYISGGTASNAGANILLYGSTYGPSASRMWFRAGSTLNLAWDTGVGWDFQANDILTTGDISGGSISTTGFTDASATGTRARVQDGNFILGAASSAYTISKIDDNSYLALSGGTAFNVGANIILYGGTAGTPYDINFRSGTVSELFFDYSANLWDFQANAIATTGNIDGATITASAGFSGPGGSITGVNAAQLNGYASATTATANTIARRDANGDLYAADFFAASGEFGSTSASWIGEYGIYLEDGKHTISVNDGYGNFNIRVGHNPLNATYADERCLEAGYLSHWEFNQSTGTWSWMVSSATLAVGDTPTFRTMMSMTADAVTLSYQGSTKLATVSNGVSVTGNITADNIGSLAAKEYWSGTQASYDGIGTPDANTIYFITE